MAKTYKSIVSNLSSFFDDVEKSIRIFTKSDDLLQELKGKNKNEDDEYDEDNEDDDFDNE